MRLALVALVAVVCFARAGARSSKTSRSSTRTCTTIRSRTRSIRSTRCWRSSAQQCHRHSRHQPPEQGDPSARGGEGARSVGGAVHPALPHSRRHPDLVQRSVDPRSHRDEYKRGYYRGIGEFHIYGKSAATEVVKKIVNFAVERDLYLHAHCDEEALLILFSHNPRAKIIWAHTGFRHAPVRVAELFDKYPALWGELSYRSGITQGGGSCRRNGAPCSRAIRTASCSAPTPGSMSAGSLRHIMKDIAAGWRNCLPSRPAASRTATPSGCSGRRAARAPSTTHQ